MLRGEKARSCRAPSEAQRGAVRCRTLAEGGRQQERCWPTQHCAWEGLGFAETWTVGRLGLGRCMKTGWVDRTRVALVA